MKIVSSDRLPQTGMLLAEVYKGELYLPSNIVKILDQQGIRTAEEFLALVECFPTAVKFLFEWDDEIYERSKIFIQIILEDLIPPVTKHDVAMGALDPDLLKKE